MTRAWIATALLAGSWLIGLGYYQPANLFAWAIMIVAATVLLVDVPVRWPTRRASIIAIGMLLVPAWLMALPYKAIPLLLLGGLLLHVLPTPRRWPGRFAGGCAVAALILTAQALTMECYASLTARQHELPWPLTHLVGLVPRMLGLDAGICCSIRRLSRSWSAAWSCWGWCIGIVPERMERDAPGCGAFCRCWRFLQFGPRCVLPC
jgi:hypothetical protein